MCLTLLPTTALANSPDTSGGNSNPITVCNHALGTDGNCSKCGKTLIAQMTIITAEGGTATSYLAALDSLQLSEIDLLNVAFGSSSVTVVKLLKDVISTTSSATLSFTSPNQTLDLNGHKLDTKGGGIMITQTSFSASEDNSLPVLTITDSSSNKNGELKAQISLNSGSLTINSGKLTAKESDSKNGLISINKASMTVSGTAKVSCSTIKIVTSVTSIGSNGEPGSLTIQDNAEITGGIAVNTENANLIMTGGKIQMQPLSDPLGDDMIYVYGGKVRISGGNINNTLVVSSGDVELSGGIYSKLCKVMNDLPSVADLLKNGYAYYSKESDTSESYTKLTTPTIPEAPNDYISMVENVAVNPHVCKFTQSGEVWRCDCGRIAVQTPIPYVNENGKTAYCTKYKEIDDDFSTDILKDS